MISVYLLLDCHGVFAVRLSIRDLGDLLVKSQ